MKTVATILITAVSALVLATACDIPVPEAIKVSGVTLDRETLLFTVGDDEALPVTLKATVTPAEATNKAVTWSSSRPDIATVDGDGKVTAVGEGTAEIMVSTEDGNKEDVCDVTVEVENKLPEIIDLLNAQYIPDAVFLSYCEGRVAEWDTDRDGGLSRDEAAAVTEMSMNVAINGNTIRSLKGMEHFTGLETLECHSLNNNLTVLDLTRNTALRKLVCNGNTLTSLNVSGCTALESLDVSGCLNLKELNCFSNRLAELDVSKCVVLEFLNAEGNRLTELDVAQNTRLQTLFCNGNRLIKLDVSQNTALESLDVAGNDIVALDLSNNPALTLLKCSNNGLAALDVSNCTVLRSLACAGNGLTVLDVSKCADLTDLDCYDNRLTALDVSQNTALAILSCEANSLAELDLANNNKLELFSCGNNKLSALTVGAMCERLNYFGCQNNVLSAAQLDDIFRALPDTGPEGPTYTIAVNDNPGAATCDKRIAEMKNWKVQSLLTRARS